MPDLVLLGPPGSGKGTQAKPLAAARGLAYLSTGELLRAAGAAVRRFLDAGELVPDALLFELLGEAMPAGGVLLDGFPRTLSQAKALDERTAVEAILLDVPDDVVVERLAGRGRDDDTPDTVRRRLAVYHEQTEPLIAYYERGGRLVRVDGVGTAAEVGHRMRRAMNSGAWAS
ncbi:adenylate kinase [Solirubrobacter soli]|uniref:adenylate kinase n=1 Tax=Solirubrobacter soli TaxID=363832 RepID=UPI00042A3703|nr:adenylate kinase [Solirubrobacter soli]